MSAHVPSSACPTCGNSLEPTGECNICLLQLGISEPTVDCVNDGSLPSLQDLNAQFPQLEVMRLLGRGGMGAVYHARQTSLDRDVALKVIAKEVSSDPAFVERFAREAKTLAKLSHPNIVNIFDYGQTSDGTAYLILEFVDGINLREAIRGGSVGADEALHVVSTICRALEYAHSKGVVHRDIKPENILLGEDGTLKVADFGIAKIVDDGVRAPTLTATRQVLGSLHYLAPEHLEAPEQVDHRVDLYALGVIFYELLTGQLPLGRYEAPSRVHDRVDQSLDSIVLKTLSRKPDQRYQRASELDAELDQIETALKDRPATSATAPDATRSAQATGPESVSVPFTCDAANGLSSAIGALHIENDTLCTEFKVLNLFGYLKSTTHVIQLPRTDLTRLELIPSFFASKLVLSARTISALGELPNAETGRVELKIKRDDEGRALELTRALGFDSTQTVTRSSGSGPIAWPNEPSEFVRMLFGVSMVFSGLLNAGALAACLYLLSKHVGETWSVVAMIAASLLMGPLAILQIVTGILSIVGRVRALGLTTCIISMLPLTPIWIFSFPVSLWAYRSFKQNETNVPLVAKQNRWGTTTLMLMRESRWARVTGVFSTLGTAALLAAVVAFKWGYYPVEMHYRVVDANVETGELEQALQGRLQTSRGFRGINVTYNRVVNPMTLTVKTWHRYQESIENLLAVQEAPQLVWLESAESTETENSTAIPVAPGLNTASFQTVQQSLGTAIRPAADPFALSPEFVVKVSSKSGAEGNQVAIELTSVGRKELGKHDSSSASGIGLIIGGVMEALAPRESISQKSITFELSDKSSYTPSSITAGIRGPHVPTPLERLE